MSYLQASSAVGSLLPSASADGSKTGGKASSSVGFIPFNKVHLCMKGFKPTEESGFAGEDYHPSVETDGKRELAAWAMPIIVHICQVSN